MASKVRKTKIFCGLSALFMQRGCFSPKHIFEQNMPSYKLSYYTYYKRRCTPFTTVVAED